MRERPEQAARQRGIGAWVTRVKRPGLAVVTGGSRSKAACGAGQQSAMSSHPRIGIKMPNQSRSGLILRFILPIKRPRSRMISILIPIEVAAMYNALTIQTYVNGQWHDALDLSFSDAQKVAGTRSTTSYNMGYLQAFYGITENIFEYAVSVNLPVNWGSVDTKGFPAFVYDIIPAGPARKSLLKRFNDEKPKGMDIDLFLLSRCTPSPIGNLRVKESVEALEDSGAEAFARQEVVERTNRDAAKEFRALPDLLVNMPLDIRKSNALPVNDLDRHLGYWELQ